MEPKGRQKRSSAGGAGDAAGAGKGPAVKKAAGGEADIVSDLVTLKEICFGRLPVRTTEYDKATGEAVVRENYIFEPRVAKSALELLGQITGAFSGNEEDRRLEVNIKVVE